MKTMAEVLAEHYEYNWEPDAESWECQCGHLLGEDVFRRDADPNHRAHQDAALSAAGFGPVREAQAQALRGAADDFMPAWFEHKGGRIDQNQCHREWLRARATAIEATQ